VKIRVSVVRSAPGHHSYFEAQELSAITGGPSAAAGAENRPTVGLSLVGSVARGRNGRERIAQMQKSKSGLVGREKELQ
jgi:hypothetical protein